MPHSNASQGGRAMNVLVIGGGGREQALAWKIAQSPRVAKVFVAPGNAGTALEPALVNVALTAIADLVALAQAEPIALTVVGPEAPLAAGIVDAFRAAGLRIFGPSQAAARLESSKDYAKAFMARRAIPTAAYRSFTAAGEAHAYVAERGAPIVVKADGMAAYSPAPVVTPAVHARIMREIILPTVQGMADEGIPYTGFLYAGVIIDAAGNPRTLEFNCRLGDPEAQPMMLRLKSDLVELLLHATNGALERIDAEWDRRVALGVVLAAAGYPDQPRNGDLISGLDAVPENCKIFHAGTALADGGPVTAGGRVLCVTALGETVRQAQRAAYAAVAGIHFDGMQYRKDIGNRALPVRRG